MLVTYIDKASSSQGLFAYFIYFGQGFGTRNIRGINASQSGGWQYIAVSEMYGGSLIALKCCQLQPRRLHWSESP